MFSACSSFKNDLYFFAWEAEIAHYEDYSTKSIKFSSNKKKSQNIFYLANQYEWAFWFAMIEYCAYDYHSSQCSFWHLQAIAIFGSKESWS